MRDEATLPRSCPICGASLEDRHPRTITCSAACRRARARVHAIVDGRHPRYRSLAEYEARRGIGPPRQASTPRPPNRLSDRARPLTNPASDTRRGRAERFVVETCREQPGHLTVAQRIFAAYQQWCRRHEPDRAVSYRTFLKVLDEWLPHEGRVILPDRGTGRPRVAFQGVILRRDASRAA